MRTVHPGSQNIGLHIGRRPTLAFGNSDGDLAMKRLALIGLLGMLLQGS